MPILLARLKTTLSLGSRPLVLAALVGLGLSGCADAPLEPEPPVTSAHYAAIEDGDFTIPPVAPQYLTARTHRQMVAYNGPESVGTIVVDPFARFLYLVTGSGEAIRYGIAVGRAGYGFAGSATIRRKVEWPSWTPTRNMIRREPELYADYAAGLPGGLSNPLGARALYLYRGNRDTFYRIHGTNEQSSIGHATSAGCIRLFNQDIVDLFLRVPNGTPVRVRTQSESLALEGPQPAFAAAEDLGEAGVETPQG